MVKALIEIAQCCDTDKSMSPGYLDNFNRHLGHLRDEPIKLLELGVYHGGSLLMWNEYFNQGHIVGVDLSSNPLKILPERVRFYRGSQDDEALLDRIAAENAQEGFDIIIDDASHIGVLARASFRKLFNEHLKPGGVYVIEDWGTGYWRDWPDGILYQPLQGNHSRTPLLRAMSSWIGQKLAMLGKSRLDPNFSAHNFGMVGFVKELVDQVAWADISHSAHGNCQLAQPHSAIRELAIHHGQVFVVKN